VLTLFQPGTVIFDADILRNSATPLETYVRVGERVGVAARPGGAHAHALADDDPDWLRSVAAAAGTAP